jgi:hypothetical protein
MPFGGGPRFCPGRYLALLEAKMVLATTLASFELEPTGDPVGEPMGMTMQPRGLKVRLRPPKPHTQCERSGQPRAASRPGPWALACISRDRSGGEAPERMQYAGLGPQHQRLAHAGPLPGQRAQVHLMCDQKRRAGPGNSKRPLTYRSRSYDFRLPALDERVERRPGLDPPDRQARGAEAPAPAAAAHRVQAHAGRAQHRAETFGLHPAGWKPGGLPMPESVWA